MLSKSFVLSLITLHLTAAGTDSNAMCKPYTRPKWACPPPWFLWGGNCYKAIVKLLTWHQAKDECLKMGSVLVVPQSDEEAQFLLKLLPRRIWIDCNDIENEGWLKLSFKLDVKHMFQT